MSTASLATREAPNPWWVGFVSGLASYIDACAIVFSGIAFVIYRHTIGLTDGQYGALSGALTFSIAVGALFGGRLGDRFGRKHVFSVTMVLIVIGAVTQVLAGAFLPLLAGTILVGLGTGADLPVSLATIAESADDDNRGKIIVFSNILWVVGILGAIIASSIVGNWGRLGGQIMFAHVGAVALVTLLLRLTIPESEAWKKARAERAAGIGTVRAERTSVADLLHQPYTKPFVALIFFYALVNIAANTGGQFLTGIAVDIVGLDVAFWSRVSLIMMPLGFIWAFWAMRVIDTPKRMPYFYIGAALFLVSIAMYPVFGFHLWTLVTAQLINGVGSAFAFEGIMKVWTQESFPTLLRTTAQGSIIAVARVVAAVVATFTTTLLFANPRGFYAGLFVAVAIGYAFAVWGFHGKQRNEFAVEVHDEADVAAAEEAGLDFTVAARPKA